MSNLTIVQDNDNKTDSMLQLIERVALDPNSDVSKLEKLIELSERVSDRQAKSDFDNAMLNFQINKGIIEKKSTANKTKYAKLEHIQDIVDPVLRQFNLFVRWTTTATNSGKIRVTCICTHVGGHSETSSMDVNPDKSGSKSEIQADGSAMTYAQRYTMKTLLGLVITEENDGNVKVFITPTQVKILEKKLSFLGGDVKEKMVAHIGCELHEIERGAFDYWCNALDSKVAKKDSQ